MGRKRDKPTQQPAEEDIESSDASDDSENEITFNPTTKEERKKQEEQMHEANGDEESDEGDEDGDEDMVNVEFEFSDPRRRTSRAFATSSVTSSWEARRRSISPRWRRQWWARWRLVRWFR